MGKYMIYLKTDPELLDTLERIRYQYYFFLSKEKHITSMIVVIIKVHLTPNIFFAKITRLISWSNVAQKFFELVKSSNFYAPPKYVKMRPFWFATEFNRAWVEGRM